MIRLTYQEGERFPISVIEELFLIRYPITPRTFCEMFHESFLTAMIPKHNVQVRQVTMRTSVSLQQNVCHVLSVQMSTIINHYCAVNKLFFVFLLYLRDNGRK